MNPAPATSVVSVRQAVCDASRAVIGYEVLTGDPDAPPASARFCARALLEAFTDVDLDLVAPHHPAYLTVAPALLLRLDMLPVSPDRVVLQVETAATVHEEVVAAVSRLAGYGYAFAAVDPPSPAALSHLPEIGIVRLDMADIYPIAVGGRVRPFLAAGLEVHAVGVESFQVFEACVDAGCHAFQGPFRALPALDQAPAVELGAMATAGELLAPDLDSERLEALIARDLELSYRLLRYANSAFFKRRREIGTVREAITLIGERMTRRWALVVALAGGGTRPDELLTDALVRARTMELVAAGPARAERRPRLHRRPLLDAAVARQPADGVRPQRPRPAGRHRGRAARRAPAVRRAAGPPDLPPRRGLRPRRGRRELRPHRRGLPRRAGVGRAAARGSRARGAPPRPSAGPSRPAPGRSAQRPAVRR